MALLKKRYIFAGAAGIALIALVVWGINDFNEWKRLGKGGLEHSFVGWSTVTAVSLLKRDPLDVETFSAGIGQQWDLETLDTLPVREGPRPQIASHPIPHRQLDQIADLSFGRELHRWLEELGEADEQLVFKRSHTEKHNDALWIADVDRSNPTALNNGEIAHVHQIDGSLHVIVSPSDAKVILDRGWGELHSLSGISGVLPSKTYVLLYAARNEAEQSVHKQIVSASVAFTRLYEEADDR